jgi:hypothetical protein
MIHRKEREGRKEKLCVLRVLRGLIFIHIGTTVHYA